MYSELQSLRRLFTLDRKTIIDYAGKTYKSTPEYLWAKYPDYAVLRHHDNNKWYAVIMNVSKDKLGLDGTAEVDIMDIKCEPDLIGSLRMTRGIFPGYHMNKGHWISVLLDGSVDESMVYSLLGDYEEKSVN